MPGLEWWSAMLIAHGAGLVVAGGIYLWYSKREMSKLLDTPERDE